MTNRRIPVVLACFALFATLTWTACGGSSGPTCTPAAETCNGLDDDCDGQVDDGFDLGAACTAGVGACQVSGVRVCAASGADAACSAVPGDPTVETCNQQDDDCDGQVDQGLAGCCVPAATRACGVDVGACRAGLETCDGAGAWGACLLAGEPVVLPGSLEESCDGLDQDCDGQTDEAGAVDCAAFYADQDQDGVGAGAAACLCAAAAPFTASEGTDCDDADAGVRPGATEACNGRDDDCDTLVDDGFDVGATCSAGVGACSVSGLLAGAAGGAAVECSAVAGDPGAEVCNGVDDDCDGATDESDPALGQACDGPDADLCAEGLVACAGGQLQCTDATGGNAEACNGMDDDCDGTTDEEVPEVGTACDGADGDLCLEGALTCQGVAGLICGDATATSVELCNGLDDDCDGQTDEGFALGQACSAGTGACLRSAFTVCRVDGTGTTCPAIPGTPSPEVCNAVDDDCDGSTDENPVIPLCAKQSGVCVGARATEDLCVAGAWLACSDATYAAHAASFQPVEMACDGLDNDCDGTTDEGFSVGTACSAGIGACLRPGVTVCRADGTGTSCDAVAGTPSPEVCNAVDDDCDGQTDENPEIPACAKQAGVCAGARATADLCVAGAWLACSDATYAAHSASYQPVETACADGLDNDCDGQTDAVDPSCP